MNSISARYPSRWFGPALVIDLPHAHTGPGGCMKKDSDLVFAFFRRVPSGCKTSKGLVGVMNDVSH